jgi:ribosome biogenesis GTPase
MSRFDDYSYNARPSRFNSPRRSKDRPDFSSAEVGMVIAVDRGRITCVYPANAEHNEQITIIAVKARELGRKGVVIGDRVKLVGDLSGKNDTLARLVEIEERESVLMRTADDADPVERVIVANADQMAIVVATANPEPRMGLIDRALIAAYDGNLEPILVITKTDLANPQSIVNNYAGLDIRYFLIDQKTGAGVDEFRQALVSHQTVLVGHSGVGKSTLVNSLIPDAARATGNVNDVTGRGKHTSTSAVALALPNDSGWVIDTPGIRSFGLAHVNAESIIDYFPELSDGANDCPRACTHVSASGEAPPDCALDDYVTSGEAGPAGQSRLTSLRRLLAALHEPSS